jgi:hypothetical protein
MSERGNPRAYPEGGLEYSATLSTGARAGCPPCRRKCRLRGASRSSYNPNSRDILRNLTAE